MKKAPFFRGLVLLLLLLLRVLPTTAQHWYWVKTISGRSSCSTVATDSLGNLYITGYFCDTLRLPPYTLTGTNCDMYVAKLAPDGTCLWVTSTGGTGNEWSSRIALDR